MAQMLLADAISTASSVSIELVVISAGALVGVVAQSAIYRSKVKMVVEDLKNAQEDIVSLSRRVEELEHERLARENQAIGRQQERERQAERNRSRGRKRDHDVTDTWSGG